MYYRIKAGAPVYDPYDHVRTRAYPVKSLWGRRLELCDGIVSAVDTVDGSMSHEYLEPWVKGEEWNGSTWVKPSPPTVIDANDLGVDVDAWPVATPVFYQVHTINWN